MKISYFVGDVVKSFEIEPTEENFTAAMETVVQRFGPDYLYSSERGSECFYIHPEFGADRPCLIGAALMEMGVPAEWLASEHRNSVSARCVLPELGFTADVGRAANKGQSHQDEGFNWGEALSMYKHSL